MDGAKPQGAQTWTWKGSASQDFLSISVSSMQWLLCSSCFSASAYLFHFALSEPILIFISPQPQLTFYLKHQGLTISLGWVRCYS